jgi:hypothetical protein
LYTTTKKDVTALAVHNYTTSGKTPSAKKPVGKLLQYPVDTTTGRILRTSTVEKTSTRVVTTHAVQYTTSSSVGTTPAVNNYGELSHLLLSAVPHSVRLFVPQADKS